MDNIDYTLEYERYFDEEDTVYGLKTRCYKSNAINDKYNEAKEYYLKNIYNKLCLDKIKSPKLAWKIFDIAVSQGIGTAERFLKEIDGNGSLNIEHINDLDEVYVLDELIKKQILRYIDIALFNNKKYLLKDYVKRALDKGEKLFNGAK